jgi:hypothetical protein
VIRPGHLFVLLGASFALLLAPAAARADFGIEPGSLKTSFEVSEGVVGVPQASSHPYSFSIGFKLNVDGEGHSEGGAMRSILIDLPPGFAGDPFALGRCTRQEFEGLTPRCSPNSQVGIVTANLPEIGREATGPLYDMVPPPGVAAQLGFAVGGLNALPEISLRTETPLSAERYGLHVANYGLPLEATSIEVTVWGTPAESGHDSQRGRGGAEGNIGEGIAYVGPHEAFLTLPAECTEPIRTTVEVDSKLDPGHYVKSREGEGESLDAGGSPTAPQGCGSVPFGPKVAASTSSRSASSSSGLDFELGLLNEGLTNPSGIAETEPEKVEVELPPGVTANPSTAAGLAACSEEQFRNAGTTNAGCPEASKLGTLFARSPLIEEPVEGAVYLATPHANPFGSLLSLYIVAAAPERGVLIKQAGRVDIDQATGQLTTTFDGLPPLPYSSFQLNLREGPRAPLTTPLACGTYPVTARLYPFSEPGVARVRTAPFTIDSGPEGGGCVGSESQLPNDPTFEAGTQTPLAGIYSPFVLKLSRGEASQHFQALNVTLPPGLTGRLAGIAECSEAQIAQAASRSKEGEGALEQSHPSCPAGSEIGTVTVGAGAGSPLYVQGHAYLAGPYKGAPLSMAIVTPAIAGPFDLGTVVVRAALYVDESTARITVKSDPIPTSLHGIPLDVRSIAVQIARNDFTLNPTNCEVSSLGAEAISTTGGVAKLQNRFQVGGCKGLDFEPTLKLSFSGQTRRLGFPAIKAVLTQPAGENANVAAATVILPKGMLIANSHINNPCTRVQFNSTPVPGAGCPPKSVLGTAKVWTPLLEAPEEGKVYFRSNGGERQLPDLAVALRGRIPLQLLGFVDSVGKKGAEVRRVRSRFLNLPDAPVSRFELELSGGKKGLLENSVNLCKAGDRAQFQLTGQNGKSHDTEPKVQVSCGKGGGRKK